MRRLPLQAALTAPLVGIVLITGLLTGGLAFWNGQAAVHALAAQLHEAVTARISQHLDQYLATPNLINRLNLDSFQLRELDPSDLDGLERHFLAQVQRFDSVVGVTYADEQGQGVGVERKVLGADLVAGRTDVTTGNVMVVYDVSQPGRRTQIFSLPNYDARTRPWYKSAVQAGGPVWTPIFMWPTGDVGLDAVVPVRAANGHLLGVMDTSLTLNQLGDFLHSWRPSAHGATFIVDESAAGAGLLVASSTLTETFTRQGADFRLLPAAAAGDPLVEAATRALPPGLTPSGATQFTFALNGQLQMAAATPYRDAYGLNWLIVSVIPDTDLMGQVDANSRTTAGILVIAVLLATVAAALLARLVTQPLSRLSQTAQALAKGDWTRPVGSEGPLREVDDLAGSVEQMAAQLQTAFASLQSSESRYRGLFEESPVSLWEEDFSAVRQCVDECRKSGVSDWRSFFQSHPDVVASCASLVRVVDVNRAALNLFEAPDKAALLSDLTQVFTPESYAAFSDELAALVEGRRFEAEIPQKTLSGAERYVGLRLSLMPGCESTWAHVLVSLTDVTERRHSEMLVQAQNEQLAAQNQALGDQGAELHTAHAELQRVNAELERRVAARTQELSLANAALARAARQKDEFLASMSHELRTPLTAILGLSEVLQLDAQEPLSEHQRKWLGQIRESGEHLLALINDILDLSKVEAGKVEPTLAPVVVDEVCQSSLYMIRELAVRKRLHLTYAQAPEVTQVVADERRLKQMLVNLLSNAVKFTPEGGAVGLEVSGDAAQQLVCFTVWDTGIGIAAADQARLFQPFVQVDSRLSRQHTGTGLGLALVAQLAALHGGRVEVESEGVPGKGSRFTVVLPWPPTRLSELQRALDESPASQTPGGLASPSATAGPGPLILLADDNELNTTTLQRLLLAAGYTQTTVARNGREALAMIRAWRPALVLMDIQMPEMDGLEVIQILRADADAQLAATPVIAVTALAMAGDRERCLAAGADDYLAKPLRAANLKQKLDQWLGGDRLGREGQA